MLVIMRRAKRWLRFTSRYRKCMCPRIFLQTSSHFLSLSPRFSRVKYCSVLHPFMHNSTSSASNCSVAQCYFEMGARSMCGGSRRKGKALGLVRCNALANEFHEDAPLFNECNWIKVTFPLPPNEYVSYGVTYCARPTSFIPQRCPICGRVQLMRGILCCAIQGIRGSIQCERWLAGIVRS